MRCANKFLRVPFRPHRLSKDAAHSAMRLASVDAAEAIVKSGGATQHTDRVAAFVRNLHQRLREDGHAPVRLKAKALEGV